jgi:hypothetical protein
MNPPNYLAAWKTADRVITAAESFTGYQMQEIVARNRDPKLAHIRFAICLVMSEQKMSIDEISEIMQRVRKAIDYGINKAKHLEASHPPFALLVREIRGRAI